MWGENKRCNTFELRPQTHSKQLPYREKYVLDHINVAISLMTKSLNFILAVYWILFFKSFNDSLYNQNSK